MKGYLSTLRKPIGFFTALGLAFALACALPAQPTQADWTPVNGPYGKHFRKIASNGTYVYALMDSGLFRSADRGGTWTRIAPLRPGLYLNTLSVMGARVMCDSEWLLYRS